MLKSRSKKIIITEVRKSSWEECLRSFIIESVENNNVDEKSPKVSCVVDINEDGNIVEEIDKILVTQTIELPFRVNVYKKVWGPETKVKIFLFMFLFFWYILESILVEDMAIFKSTIIFFCCLIFRGVFIIIIGQSMIWYRFVRQKTYLRSNPKCTSHKRLPGFLINGGLEKRFEKPGNDYFVSEKNQVKTEVVGVKYAGKDRVTSFPIDERGKYLRRMSHQYLTIWEDLYLSLMLYPGAYYQALFGHKFHGGIVQFLYIRFKDSLPGFNTKRCEDDEDEPKNSILFEFILETTLSTMIEDIRTSKANDLEGQLVIPGCTDFTKDRKIEIGTLCVKLNITKRRITFCSFEDSRISVSEALPITAVALFGLVHSVIHSSSNWGTCSEIKSSSFLRQMSLLTIKYNHMGSGFGKFCGLVQKFGIFKYVGGKEGSAAIHHGAHTFKPHEDIDLLKDHSKFVTFFLETREVFKQEFVKYEQDFPGIEVEAMFQGTVIHSIDHTNMAILLRAENFSSSSPNSEMARFILCCFVEKPPSMIETRFSTAPHPFYRNVYRFAEKIDKRLADAMECCIDM